jgi:hypothetical protein
MVCRTFLLSSLAGAVAVSVPESNLQPVSQAATPDPRKNPSYPQRVHVQERAHWQQVLARCEEQIATARPKLSALDSSPHRAAYERLFAQMLGCRDQVADAARRLPMETGDLYEEDKHRLEEAVAALDRIVKKWDTLSS